MQFLSDIFQSTNNIIYLAYYDKVPRLGLGLVLGLGYFRYALQLLILIGSVTHCTYHCALVSGIDSSARVVPCSLLLLLASGDVDPNLSPSHTVRTLHVSTYNICSAPGKIGSNHDILPNSISTFWHFVRHVSSMTICRLSCVTLRQMDTVSFTCTEVSK